MIKCNFCLDLAVCEHAYSLAQNLDPNSEGRGVLQFKTGLMSVIKVCRVIILDVLALEYVVNAKSFLRV